MKAHVIDTNTFIVADGGAEQADLACVDAAIASARAGIPVRRFGEAFPPVMQKHG